jgi:hypothetical protein
MEAGFKEVNFKIFIPHWHLNSWGFYHRSKKDEFYDYPALGSSSSKIELERADNRRPTVHRPLSTAGFFRTSKLIFLATGVKKADSYMNFYNYPRSWQ